MHVEHTSDENILHSFDTPKLQGGKPGFKMRLQNRTQVTPLGKPSEKPVTRAKHNECSLTFRDSHKFKKSFSGCGKQSESESQTQKSKQECYSPTIAAVEGT